MTKITDTSKHRRDEWLFGGNPEAIEAQEAAGQEELSKSSQLPSNGLEKVAQACGIEVLGPSAGDALFSDVRLPEGWKIQPTEHAMWSDLVDETGKKRAAIFYKAAFYDRRADISLLSEDDA